MTAKDPVVYIVDDDPSVGRALERLIRAAGYDVKTFTSAFDFLDGIDPETPACLILDVDMPALSGLELQEHLSEKEILLPIIFITGYGTIPMSVKAMKAGAVDFLTKPFSDTDLLSAVSHSIESDRQTRGGREELKKLRERLATLTAREREVFQFVAMGLLNKQIAFELGTAEKTIKVHRARVMAKMGAQSVADLVRFAEKLSPASSSR